MFLGTGDGGLSDTWPELVRSFGVPGAIFAVLLFAILRGYLVRQGESVKDLANAKQRYEEMLKEKDDRIADLRLDRDTRLKERDDAIGIVRKEKDFWRTAALRNMEMAERTLATAKTAVDKLPDSSSPGLQESGS